MESRPIVLQGILTLNALPEDGQRVIFYVPVDPACINPGWHNKVQAGYYNASQKEFVVGAKDKVGYQWIRFAQGKVSLWLPFPSPAMLDSVVLDLT